MPEILALNGQRQKDQHGLHSELQASMGYMERRCLKKGREMHRLTLSFLLQQIYQKKKHLIHQVCIPRRPGMSAVLGIARMSLYWYGEKNSSGIGFPCLAWNYCFPRKSSTMELRSLLIDFFGLVLNHCSSEVWEALLTTACFGNLGGRCQ